MQGFVALVTQIRKRLHIGTQQPLTTTNNRCPNLIRRMRTETVPRLPTKTAPTKERSWGLEFLWTTLNFPWLAHAQSEQNMTWRRELAEIDQISLRGVWSVCIQPRNLQTFLGELLQQLLHRPSKNRGPKL